jgi:uncharacterized coiled-coil DUF342 family protein
LLESNTKKLDELNRQLAAIGKERDQLKNEARSWAEKRDALHEQMKTLRTEARGLKEKRDTINSQVNKLKSLREEAKTEQKEKRAQLLDAKEKMKALMDKEPRRSLHEIEKEIEAIDWKIQTTPIPVKEEKPLIDEVRNLEKQRAIHKRIQELRDTVIKMQTEERAFATRAELSHKKLTELAEQSQKFHEKMVNLLTKAQNLKAEADLAHLKYLEIRQRADETHQKYVETLNQIGSIKQEVQKRDKEEQAKRQGALREKIIKEAKEKMKRGEKLTWDEYKLLTEQEPTTET